MHNKRGDFSAGQLVRWIVVIAIILAVFSFVGEEFKNLKETWDGMSLEQKRDFLGSGSFWDKLNASQKLDFLKKSDRFSSLSSAKQNEVSAKNYSALSLKEKEYFSEATEQEIKKEDIWNNLNLEQRKNLLIESNEFRKLNKSQQEAFINKEAKYLTNPEWDMVYASIRSEASGDGSSSMGFLNSKIVLDSIKTVNYFAQFTFGEKVSLFTRIAPEKVQDRLLASIYIVIVWGILFLFFNNMLYPVLPKAMKEDGLSYLISFGMCMIIIRSPPIIDYSVLLFKLSAGIGAAAFIIVILFGMVTSALLAAAGKFIGTKLGKKILEREVHKTLEDDEKEITREKTKELLEELGNDLLKEKEDKKKKS